MTSRRALYAAGEPFGAGATRRKPGGGLVCGLGGDSSSSQATSSNTTTTNTYTDSRMVVDGGGLGVNTAGGAANLVVNNSTTTTDGGALAAGRDISLAGLTAARDVSITALNDNAFNTASIVAATSKLGDQTVQTLALNTNLANSIAANGLAAVKAAGASNASSFKDLLSAGLSMFASNNKAAAANLDLTEHLADGASAAYANATAEATGSKKLVIVGIVVVGVVAAFALSKGKL